MWRLSGVHRHVRLVSKPAGLAICDYACRTTAITENGGACLRIDVTLDGADALACSDMGYRVRASLLPTEGCCWCLCTTVSGHAVCLSPRGDAAIGAQQ